jgi:hypothetical protein
MGPKAPGILNIGQGQNVQLLLTPTACGVDREEYRPGNAAANQTRDDCMLEEAKEEIRVEALVLQDVGIRDLPQRSQPVESARW